MGLTFIAIVLLAGAWAAILLPDLRNRSRAPRRNNSVKSFRQQLSGLDRTRPQGMGSRPGLAQRPGLTSRPPVSRRDASMHAPRPRSGPQGGAPTRRVAGPAPSPRHSQTPAAEARSSMMPRTRAEAAKRRVLTVAVLVGLAAVLLVGGLVLSRMLLFAHLLVDSLLAGFVYLSWERTNRAAARRSSLGTLGTAQRRDETQRRGATLDLDDDDVVASITPLVRRAAGS